MLFAWLDIDNIARIDFLLACTSADIADAIGDVKRLPHWMRVPNCAGTRCEVNMCAANGGLVIWVTYGVDVDVASEPVVWAFGGLTAALGVFHIIAPPLE